MAPVGGGDDRGHRADQGGDPAREDLAGRLERVLRRLAGGARGAELGVPAPLRAGGPGPGDGQPEPHHAVLGDPGHRAGAGGRSRLQPPRGRAGALHRALRDQGRGRGSAGRGGPDGGDGAGGGAALPHPAPPQGGRGGLDRPRGGEARRGADAQRRAAAGDERGGRQVRRGRTDPAVRAAVGGGDEARGGAAGEIPGQDRGLHEGHGGAGDGLRRRARHRQVAGEHDPHQQRLHGDRPRQAGPDPDDPRRGAGARGDRDRAERAAGLDLEADAGVHPGAARQGPRLPGADRRRGDQPRVQLPRAVPGRQGIRRGSTSPASSTARMLSRAWR